MSIVLILALLIGGSATVAAEGALPGEFLYPVKVGVNEEVRGWTAVSNESRANFGARLAERRFEEIERLAARDALNGEIRTEIALRIKNHSEDFESYVDRLELDEKLAQAIEARSNLESVLRGHERVIAQIALEDIDARAEIKPILQAVRAWIDVNTRALTSVHEMAVARSDEDFKSAAEGKLNAAINKIGEVDRFLIRIQPNVSSTVWAESNVRLDLAKRGVEDGRSLMEIGEYADAFIVFQDSIRTAQEAKLIIAMRAKLKLDGMVARGGNGLGFIQRPTSTPPGFDKKPTSTPRGSPRFGAPPTSTPPFGIPPGITGPRGNTDNRGTRGTSADIKGNITSIINFIKSLMNI